MVEIYFLSWLISIVPPSENHFIQRCVRGSKQGFLFCSPGNLQQMLQKSRSNKKDWKKNGIFNRLYSSIDFIFDRLSSFSIIQSNCPQLCFYTSMFFLLNILFVLFFFCLRSVAGIKIQKLVKMLKKFCFFFIKK